MTNIVKIVLLLTTLAGAGRAFAQQDLTGPWLGKLAVDAKTSLTVQFTFTKRPDGSYSAVLDSPDNTAIKNVPVAPVSFSAGTLKMTVASLSGSYLGTLKDGKIEGRWTQPGGTLPLELSAYQKPVVNKAASGALLGAWNGPISIPGVKATYLIRFKLNDKGELTGTLSVPEQPARGEPALQDIGFVDNQLTYKVPAPGGTFTFNGTLAKGVITGTWVQAGAPPPGLALTLKRGDVAVTVYLLKLDAPSFATVAGRWMGKLTGPQGPITVVMRFEINDGGQYVGFIDVPDQGIKGIPIVEASIAAGKLTAKSNAPPAQFEGTVSGKTIVGQWLQGPPGQPPQSTALSLTRQ